MPRMTGNQYFAQAVHAYGSTHVFFVPTIMIPAMAAMEAKDIRRGVTHGWLRRSLDSAQGPITIRPCMGPGG